MHIYISNINSLYSHNVVFNASILDNIWCYTEETWWP